MQSEAENLFENRRGRLDKGALIVATGMFHRPLKKLFQRETGKISDRSIATGHQAILNCMCTFEIAKVRSMCTDQQRVEQGGRFGMVVVLRLRQPMDDLKDERAEQIFAELKIVRRR